MKNNPLFFVLTLALLSLHACEKPPVVEEPPVTDDPVAVNLTTNITSAQDTRVADDRWETSDRVGLYMKPQGGGLAASYADAKNVRMNPYSGSLTSDRPIYYPEEGRVDFVAYYPYTTSVSSDHRIAVDLSDQDEALPVEILYSNNAVGKEASTAAVPLNFRYSLARLEITVTAPTSAALTAADYATMSVSVEGMYSGADFSLVGGTFSSHRDVESIPLHRTGSTGTSASFEGLILPVVATAEATFVFTVRGQDYTHKVSATYAAATNYALAFSLDIPPPYEPVATLLSTTITPRTIVERSYTVTPPLDYSDERNVLLALYEATDGDNWIDNTNWCSDRPIWEWQGVSTDAQGRVSHLYLGRNNLSGTIPSEIGYLTGLKEVVLSDNYLSGRIPEALTTNRELWSMNWGLIVEGNYFDMKGVEIDAMPFSALDLDGQRVDFGEVYARNNYTILHQFRVSYPGDIAALKELYDTYASEGLDIIGYDYIYDGDNAKVADLRNLVSENEIPWPILPVSEDNPLFTRSFFADCYPTTIFPYITVVDSGGKVVFFEPFDSATNLKKFIGRQLNEDLPDYYTSTDYSLDGRVTLLQQATEGAGIDVVLMGDGFSDRLIADGTYGRVMDRAMEHFFAEEPYKSFRNMFNVYSIDVVSPNEVFEEYSYTALDVFFGGGTYLSGNDQACRYAGTCWMYYIYNGDHGRGLSISYFPMDTTDEGFRQVLNHEANGHGFAKLADEYFYDGVMSDETIAYEKQNEPYGWWKNADFTGDPARVKWAKFLTDPRYAGQGLGVFEGAFTYAYGAYRPTDYSIMRYNTGGFNAPSREAIYYRIHKLAYGLGWQYDYETFVAWDARNRTQTAMARRAVENSRAGTGVLLPLAPPVVVPHSWREGRK